MLIQEEHTKQQHHTMQLLTFPKKKRQVKTIYHSKSKSVPQSSSRGEERVRKAARSGTISDAILGKKLYNTCQLHQMFRA